MVQFDKSITSIGNPIWDSINIEANAVLSSQREMSSLIYSSILNHKNLESVLSYRLAQKLSTSDMSEAILNEIVLKSYLADSNLIDNAYSDIKAGKSSKILVISPEITSGHNNFKNRDGHFIFGDVCTAVVIEKNSKAKNKFRIVDTKLKTAFSNNIRNNFGYMNAIEDKNYSESEQLFFQNGRRVFKEVMPFVSSLILDQLNEQNLLPENIERYWLHQANINMNAYVIKKLLGDNFSPARAPIILDEYANTSSAGSIIAFHKHNHLEKGQKGIICSFGAGYSICSILLEKA